MVAHFNVFSRLTSVKHVDILYAILLMNQALDKDEYLLNITRLILAKLQTKVCK